MKEKGIKKLFQTMMITGIAFVFNYGINLVLTPYIIRNVGTDAYGFVSLAKQFAQYATIITMTLNSFATRHIVMAYHNNRMKEANIFFSSVFYGDVVLVTGVVSIAGVGILFLEKILQIPDTVVLDVKWLFFWVFVNMWVTTVFTAHSSSAFVKNKLNIVGIFRGISYGLEALVLTVLYWILPPKVYYVGIGLIAASLVIACSNVCICRKYTPELRIHRKNVSLRAIRSLVLDGIWTSINELGTVLNSGLDLMVCNLMLTPLEMGELAVAKMIGNIFLSLFQLVAQPFQPLFLKSYAAGDKEKLLGELKFSMKVSGLLASIGFAGFTALGMAYYRLWIPNENIELIYILTVLTIVFSVPGGPMQPLYYIYTLTVKKKIPCIVTFTGGILNVLGMYLLIRFTGLGVYAIVLTTAVIMCITNFVINPLYMAHVLEFPWHIFFPNVIRNVLGCGALVLLFKVLARWYEPNSWLMLGVCAVIYAAVGVVVYFPVVCEREDWNRLKNIIVRG